MRAALAGRPQLVVSLLLALLFNCASLRTDAQPVVIPLEAVDIATLAGGDASAQEALRRFRELASTSFVGRELRTVRLDPRVLDKLLGTGPSGTQTIRLRLFDGLEVEVAGRALSPDSDAGLRVWSGSVTALVRQDNAVRRFSVPCTIVWDDQSLSANIALPGGPVQIRTIGPNLHAVFRVDADGLPQEHVVADGVLDNVQVDTVETLPGKAAKINGPARRDSSNRFVIRVAFAFTNDAAKEIWARKHGNAPFNKAAALPLLKTFARIQVTEANEAFANNGIPIALEVKGVAQRNIDEEPTTTNFRNEMVSLLPASSKKAKGQESSGLHCWWAEQEANSLFLVGSFGGNPAGQQNIPGFCGATNKPAGTALSKDDLAHMYDEDDRKAGRFGYSVVKKVCVDAHYTFLHELGHQLGADHEKPKANPNRVTLMPSVANGTGTPVAFGKVVNPVDDPAKRVVSVEVVGADTKDRKFRVPMFTSRKAVPKSASDNVANDKWGDAEHDDASIIVAMAEQLSRRTLPKCPAVP